MQRIIVTSIHKQPEKKAQDELSDLKKLGLPLAEMSILVVILSIIKQIAYYSNFSVPIKLFLGLSELGMLISQDLLILLIVFTAYSFSVNPIMNTQIYQKTKLEMLTHSKKISAVLAIAIVLLAVWIYFEPVYFKQLRIVSFLLYFAGGYVVYKNSSNDKSLEYIFVMITALILFLFAMEIFAVSSDIKAVENGKYNGTVIKTEKREYKSSDSSYFIGKTDNWVFIYNKQDSTTSIIPVESVTGITLKSK